LRQHRDDELVDDRKTWLRLERTLLLAQPAMNGADAASGDPVGQKPGPLAIGANFV
jgi:hypothetical protein